MSAFIKTFRKHFSVKDINSFRKNVLIVWHTLINKLFPLNAFINAICIDK